LYIIFQLFLQESKILSHSILNHVNQNVSIIHTRTWQNRYTFEIFKYGWYNELSSKIRWGSRSKQPWPPLRPARAAVKCSRSQVALLNSVLVINRNTSGFMLFASASFIENIFTPQLIFRNSLKFASETSWNKLDENTH